jgi:thiol-disulfide isomerase/thioredoxin
MNSLPRSVGRKVILGLALAAVTVALATIDGTPDTFSGSPPLATTAKAPLRFTLKDLNGADVRLDSFEGKVVLLNFWATWCGPCRAEIPDLIDLQAAYPDDVAVLGVVVLDRFGENVTRFASELNINYPILDGTARSDVEDAFAPMWGLPTTIFIGRDGLMAKKHSGIGSMEQFEREIRALL